MKRTITKNQGVYQRESETKTHKGKPDICFDISYKSDGKKIWEKVGWASEGYTARLANEIRADRLRSIRHGAELPKQKKKVPFFKDVVEKYLKTVSAYKCRAGRDDRGRYENHLASRFDGKRLSEISSFDLERVKSELSKEGLAPATVKHCLVLMRQVYNKATLWGMYDGQNPIKGLKMPTLSNQRVRFLSHEEADLLLSELVKKSKALHDMALLSLHCGLRAGEIFNLKAQDLNFQNDIVHISDPKNKTSRNAFMTEDVKEMLLKRVPSLPDEYVFKDKNGHKIKEISSSFDRVIKQMGLNSGVMDPRQKVCFHSLRHTFASWLCLQGETLLTVKELLGHKSLAMTERYSHLVPDHKRRATLALERDFNEKRNGNSLPEIQEDGK